MSTERVALPGILRALNHAGDVFDRLGWRGRNVSHASYLANLASPDPALWEKSVEMMRHEITRCHALSIPYLVFHPGAHLGRSNGVGILLRE